SVCASVPKGLSSSRNSSSRSASPPTSAREARVRDGAGRVLLLVLCSGPILASAQRGEGIQGVLRLEGCLDLGQFAAKEWIGGALDSQRSTGAKLSVRAPLGYVRDSSRERFVSEHCRRELEICSSILMTAIDESLVRELPEHTVE